MCPKSYLMTAQDEKPTIDGLTGYGRQLPEGYPTVVNLFLMEGYTHKEIGAMLF
jgi:hypothetical protein